VKDIKDARIERYARPVCTNSTHENGIMENNACLFEINCYLFISLFIYFVITDMLFTYYSPN